MLSIRDQENFEIARKMSAEVLAMAAVDLAKNLVLTEAVALELADKFAEAAEIARTRREKANRKVL